METIIGLLFVLLPVIMKLIGNKLEQAGKNEKAGKIRDFSKKYLDSEQMDEGLEDISQWFNGDTESVSEEEAPEPVIEPLMDPTTFYVNDISEEAVSSLKILKKEKRKAPVLLEEEENKKKEKIDPKKLVIYSEIMKPKYTD